MQNYPDKDYKLGKSSGNIYKPKHVTSRFVVGEILMLLAPKFDNMIVAI